MDHASQPTDLPLRTWRLWWRELPGYWRIGAWAAICLLVMHVALVIWMIPGFYETREIIQLRQQGALVRYRWQNGNLLWNRTEARQLMPGIYGRKPSQVESIQLLNPLTNQDVLTLIGDHFPNVQLIFLNDRDRQLRPDGLASLKKCPLGQLILRDGIIDDDSLHAIAGLPNLISLSIVECDIVAADLSPLLNCQALQHVDFSCSSLNDAQLKPLGELKKLWSWILDGTRITNSTLSLLQQRKLNHPQSISVSYTDVSLPAIQAWRQTAIGTLRIETDHDLLGARAVIRWADGRLRSQDSGNYFGAMSPVLRIECLGPLTADGEASPESTRVALRAEGRLDFDLPKLVDGKYQMILKIDELTTWGYDHEIPSEKTINIEEIKSEPIMLDVQNGKIPAGRIEFRMPVTKAEALKSAVK